MIEFKGGDIFTAVEQFYTTSEQRRTRLFRLQDEEFVQISAEPDCDEIWLTELALENVLELEQTEHLTLLETRGYVFECGCSVERLMPIIMRLPQDDLDHIFEDGVAQITCPRCGAVFRTPKASFDEWKKKQS
jgi:molecular chaperone Hsp33